MTNRQGGSPLGLLLILGVVGVGGGFIIDLDLPTWATFVALWFGGMLVLIGAVWMSVVMGSAHDRRDH